MKLNLYHLRSRDQSVSELARAASPPGFIKRMEARAEARKERMRLAHENRARKIEERKKREEAARLRYEERQRQRQIQVTKFE